MNIFYYISRIQQGIEHISDSFWSFFIKRAMGHCGKNVMIKPSTSIFKGLENIYISDDVRIARYAVIYTTKAKVYIGSKVDIAPYLKIITGNHRTNNIGHFMFDGDINKNPNDDKDVIIEGDSWFGINVTLLSGVTIGRGSCIAAGAVVTKSCPPYSIIGGTPAKVLKFRFTIDEILKHEKKLYPEEKRFTKEELISQRKNYI
jgi:acetyltransferase-like isoleucine patch superfamily enzyme